MRITKNMYMLEVKGEMGSCNPVLAFVNGKMILIDTAYPMQFHLLKTALESACEEYFLENGRKFNVTDIDNIIITHQDLDHIGNVLELKNAAPSARVIAHELEAPYLDGTTTPIKLANYEKNLSRMTQEQKEFYVNFKAGFDNRRFEADECVTDGQVLENGEIIIIHTPGHTLGHICVYFPNEKTLIAGDALNIADGVLTGANPIYTQFMDEAARSIQKLLSYDVEKIVSYHGGLFVGDVRECLRML